MIEALPTCRSLVSLTISWQYEAFPDKLAFAAAVASAIRTSPHLTLLGLHGASPSRILAPQSFFLSRVPSAFTVLRSKSSFGLIEL